MDVTVVVPSHNGARRLPATLAHIAGQRPPAGLDWEVILVDNGSTDGTARAAATAWPVGAPVALRVVHEPRLGLANAHVRGFAEARGEIVTWVEDDNWVAPDWLEHATRAMQDHPDVGACGGHNEPVCEIDPPAWFEGLQGYYACGSQEGKDRGYLWGAGLTVRKAAWDHLMDQGFQPLLSDRRGTGDYNSGGDSEICFALRLSGWGLRFEPGLRLRHFLLAHRLGWRYLRRLCRGVGTSSIGLDPYLIALGSDGPSGSWVTETRSVLAELPGRPWRATEGDPRVLERESRLGRLAALLRARGSYDRSFQAIGRAGWRA